MTSPLATACFCFCSGRFDVLSCPGCPRHTLALSTKVYARRGLVEIYGAEGAALLAAVGSDDAVDADASPALAAAAHDPTAAAGAGANVLTQYKNTPEALTAAGALPGAAPKGLCVLVFLL